MLKIRIYFYRIDYYVQIPIEIIFIRINNSKETILLEIVYLLKNWQFDWQLNYLRDHKLNKHNHFFPQLFLIYNAIDMNFVVPDELFLGNKKTKTNFRILKQ